MFHRRPSFISFKYSSIHWLAATLVLICACYRCFNSNCYTARTLEKKRWVFSPGLECLVFVHRDDIEISKEPPFLPALGIHYGLTNHLEIGLRGFFPYTSEIVGRWQLTPRDWSLFDLSTNIHIATLKATEFLYMKCGLALGRKIWQVEPVIGYYWYTLDQKELELFTTPRLHSFVFGLGVPWKGATVIPEINWYFGSNHLKDGFGVLSLGVRIPIEKSPKP